MTVGERVAMVITPAPKATAVASFGLDCLSPREDPVRGAYDGRPTIQTQAELWSPIQFCRDPAAGVDFVVFVEQGINAGQILRSPMSSWYLLLEFDRRSAFNYGSIVLPEL